MEGDWRGPGINNPDGPNDNPITTWGTNTNGIDEYTASNFGGAMQGNLIAGVNSGVLRRVELNPDGSLQSLTANFASGLGGNALGITCNGDLDVFPGTIWAGTLGGAIIILEPDDLVNCIDPGQPGYDPNADYDSDGYINQDEEDNGSDPCNGGSQPNDFDKSAGAPLVSDLNDLDDDNDGILDQNDPFQLGDPSSGGSDAFTLPIQNGLFNDQQGLGGIFGLGMTGLMNNGDPNPNWLNWLDDRGQGPNPDDVLGGAPGLMTSHMTSGTANGTTNTQEKGYQYGVQVDQTTGVFTVSGNLINFNGPLQLYGNSAAVGGELGLFIGDGTQSNFIKFVITTAGLTALQEINDVPQTPINVPIAIPDRPQSEVLFYFVVNPTDGNVSLEYTLDGGSRIVAGSVTAQGSILTAIQQNSADLAVGFIGTSNTAGVELEGTWDFLNVVQGNAANKLRINAGGTLVSATDGGGDWQANDSNGPFVGNGFTVNTGLTFNSNLLFADKHSSIPAYIDEATFNSLFAKERFDNPNGQEMEFKVPLQNGTYMVNLYMGNSFDGTSGVGQRVFDIEIEGNLVENDLDLIASFGHKVGGMLSYEIPLTDGELNIKFLHDVIENPLVNAIEIVPSSSPDIPIVLQPIADQTNTEGEQLDGSLAVQASGGDGNLVYSATGLPPGIMIEPTNGQIGGTVAAGASANSPYAVTIIVDDGDGKNTDAVSTSFSWTIFEAIEGDKLRINAGGVLVNATDGGGDWQANDSNGPFTGNGFTVNTGLNFSGNLLFADKHSSIPAYIDEATFNALFAKERFDNPNGQEMEFKVPLQNGTYTVNLYMGNSFDGTSEVGQRVFDIEIEGNLVENDLDLIASFGHKVGGMLSYEIPLTDGELNIKFLHDVIENPLVNAIEIVPSSSPGIPIVVQPIADQTNTEGEQLAGNLGVQASGGDGNLVYSAVGLPPGIMIEPTNGQIGGTVAAGASANSPYTVTITVDDSDGKSTDTVSTSFSWTIDPQPQQGIVSFTLIDADIDVDLFELTEGMQINFSTIKGKNLTIRANTNQVAFGSVLMDLDGPVSNYKTESYQPYALYGDYGWSDYVGVPFKPGSYSMQATPFKKKYLGGGVAGSDLTVNFTIIDDGPPQPGVLSFTLIDADADVELLELTEGMEVDWNLIKGKRLTIRANTYPERFGSVVMRLRGPVYNYKVENYFPYTLYGDSGSGNYAGVRFKQGSYTMKSVPYKYRNRRGGKAGKSLTISFSVVDNDTASKTTDASGDNSRPLFGAQIYPNPTANQAEISINDPNIKLQQIYLYDLTGRMVKQFTADLVAVGSGQYQLDVQGLEEGIYFLSLYTTEGDRYNYELIVKK